MSRKSSIFAAVVALSVVSFRMAAAQGSATQTVTFEVQKINVVSVAGTPSLVITAAVPGSQPTQVSDATSTYAVTTNDVNSKLTVEIDSNMGAGLTLKANMTAPSVGTSAGAVTLSATAADAVTGLTKVIGSALTITYTLNATVAAGIVASSTRTVTLTFVSGT